MDTTEQLIDKLTNAVSFKFKEDATSPNLTISRLRKGYYCSVVRYTKGAAPKNKVVVCKAEADTLASAVEKVAVAFLKVANPQPDPLQELANFAAKDSK
jgi:hypothetical protein